MDLEIKIWIDKMPIVDQNNSNNIKISISKISKSIGIEFTSLNIILSRSYLVIQFKNIKYHTHIMISGPKITASEHAIKMFMNKYPNAEKYKNRYIMHEQCSDKTVRQTQLPSLVIHNIPWSNKIRFYNNFHTSAPIIQIETFDYLNHYKKQKTLMDEFNHICNLKNAKIITNNIPELLNIMSNITNNPMLYTVSADTFKLSPAIICEYMCKNNIITIKDNRQKYYFITVKDQNNEYNKPTMMGINNLMIDAQNMLDRSSKSINISHIPINSHVQNLIKISTTFRDKLNTNHIDPYMFALSTLDEMSELIQEYPKLRGEVTKYLMPHNSQEINHIINRIIGETNTDIIILCELINHIKTASNNNMLPTSSSDPCGIKNSVRKLVEIWKLYPNITIQDIEIHIPHIKYLDTYLIQDNSDLKYIKKTYWHPLLKINTKVLNRLQKLPHKTVSTEFIDHPICKKSNHITWTNSMEIFHDIEIYLDNTHISDNPQAQKIISYVWYQITLMLSD